tara:strand:- start:499 stop:840 length:342 start_codon:yes stop_codon:yes gene_type:complete
VEIDTVIHRQTPTVEIKENNMSEFTAAEAQQCVEEKEVRSLDDRFADHMLDLYYEDIIEDWQDCLKAIDYLLDPATTRVEREYYIAMITPSQDEENEEPSYYDEYEEHRTHPR